MLEYREKYKKEQERGAKERRVKKREEVRKYI